MRFAAVALAALGVSALLGAAGLLRPSLVQAALYLFVYGWLGLLGLSQLYKIVPFLTWIERFGSRLGRARDLPRVQDLVDEPRDRPWFLLYAASAALGAIAVATGSEPLLRLAGAGGACAVLGVARALRHARVGSPVASPSPIGRPARR
jgi:hypothetical protein